MCTVSYIGFSDQIIFTSNRDEQLSRPVATPPEISCENGIKIIFPRDPKAGGTWFIANSDAKVAILLNGAEKKHTPEFSYRKSRGLILMDIMKAENSFDKFSEINLFEIEPFTIVLFEFGKLYQLRWNSSEKSVLHLNSTKNYIWSSSTLYDPKVILQREKLFYNFLKNNTSPKPEDVKNFHKSPGTDSMQEGFIINREGNYKTFSITQVQIQKNVLNFNHYDLLNDTASSHSLELTSN